MRLNVRFNISFAMVCGSLLIFPAKMLSWYHKHIDWSQMAKVLGPLQMFIEVTFFGEMLW